MSHHDWPRVGYVLKRYPRYSETFIVNEIAAHEEAGLPIEIFSLRPPTDTFFPEQVSRVRASVHYVPSSDLTAREFWAVFEAAEQMFVEFDEVRQLAREEGVLIHDFFQAVWLAVEAPRRHIEHLHAHFASSAATIARFAARLAGLTYSLTAHAKDIFHKEVQADDLAAKLRDAAAAFTVSDFNRDYLCAHFGEAADRVHRLYNGLDLKRFPFTSPGDRPPQILGVGRLVEKKGFSDLIDACAILAKRGRPFTCQIIGGGELEGDLAARIAQTGLSGVVQLLGPRAPSEVADAIRSAAVVVAPCVVGGDGNRDGLPTVLLEAMALGTPCVSTNVTGIPEIVKHGETGLAVPERDPHSLANAIERLIDDSALRVTLAQKARKLIESGFDIHRNTAQMRRLFRSADPGPASAARQLQEVG